MHATNIPAVRWALEAEARPPLPAVIAALRACPEPVLAEALASPSTRAAIEAVLPEPRTYWEPGADEAAHGRRKVRWVGQGLTVSERVAAIRKRTWALHAEHGGGVANAYGYRASTEVSVKAAGPRGELVEWRGEASANKVTLSKAGSVAWALVPQHAARAGQAAWDGALASDADRRAVALAELSGPRPINCRPWLLWDGRTRKHDDAARRAWIAAAKACARE